MDFHKNQEELMLMKQRYTKPRSQSLPQAAVGLETGQPTSRLFNPTSTQRVAHWAQRFPQMINLNHNNPPCEKLDTDRILFESPSPEIRRKPRREDGEGRRTRQKSCADSNFRKDAKGCEIEKYNMSTLQVPSAGNSNIR